MSTRDNQKKVKIFYLDEKQIWQPYSMANLHLDIQQNCYSLRIVLSQKLEPQLLPILPATPLLQPKENTIQIDLQRISKVQKLCKFVWMQRIRCWQQRYNNGAEDEEYCDVISQQIELSISSRSTLPCQENQLIEYVAEQIENNPFFVEIFFNSEDVIAAFVKQAQKYQKIPECVHKKTVFRALKLLLLRADRPSLQILLKQQYYQQVLIGFSFNYQFGDRMICYHQEYRKSTNCSNVLEINDPTVLAKYKQIIRIKFLIHVATSMFIEPPAEAVLNQILQENSFTLLRFLSENPESLAKANDLALVDPQAFIQLFSELWEMFKSVMDDATSVIIKRNFKDLFVSENIINTSFQTVLQLSSQGKGNGRLYQQYLQALNPFLSHKWNESQQLLLFLFHQGQPHILQLLLSILNIADYNTKNIILVFAKNLVEISDNRPKMKQSYLNYFFNEFVSKCVKYFCSTEELEILVDFILKVYRMDLMRTRRSIMESQLFQKIEKNIENKYILMLVLKMFRYFLQFKNQGIFAYLQRRDMFRSVRLKYFEVKKYSPNGIIYSLFLGLLKDVGKTDNVEGVKYVHNLMFPESRVS